jgi:hypothetical protein
MIFGTYIVYESGDDHVWTITCEELYNEAMKDNAGILFFLASTCYFLRRTLEVRFQIFLNCAHDVTIHHRI